MRYVAVEISARQRARHPEGVTSTDELPSERFDGVIVAGRAARQSPVPPDCVSTPVGAERLRVDIDRSGLATERLSAPLDPVPAVLPTNAPPRSTSATRRPRRTMGRRCTRSAEGRGSLVVFDYGVPRTAELATRPWREWLRTSAGTSEARIISSRPESRTSRSTSRSISLLPGLGPHPSPVPPAPRNRRTRRGGPTFLGRACGTARAGRNAHAISDQRGRGAPRPDRARRVRRRRVEGASQFEC